MRRVHCATLAAVAVIGFASMASAADMPTKAPIVNAPVAVPYNWTGFYVGANGGYGWTEKCWFSVNQNKDEGCHNPNGGLGGGQAGFNWQTGSFVFGAEVSGDWASMDASHVTPLNSIVTLHTRVNSIFTAAARVGVAWNNVLAYAKGGGAWVHDKYDETVVTTLATEASETRAGWLGGVGVEYGFTPNLSAAVEYDYIGLGTRTVGFTPVVAPYGGFDERIKQSVQIVTLRVNYRFGGLFTQ
jgi:outer membrane immunogenic protein